MSQLRALSILVVLAMTACVADIESESGAEPGQPPLDMSPRGAPLPGGFPPPSEIDPSLVDPMGIVPPPAIVQLDVLKECIDMTSNGVVLAVIYGSASFDVTHVIPATVRLAGAPLIGWSYMDANRDGDLDFKPHFRGSDMTDLQLGGTVAEVTGVLSNAELFIGQDSVTVVESRKFCP